MRLAIFGASKIVPAFVEVCTNISDIEIVSISALDIGDKVNELIKRLGITKIYNDYHIALMDSNVDAVYIATPNDLHYPMAKDALFAGKHVILEKPFVLHLRDAEELFSIAQQKGLFIFEAITTIHLPHFL